MFATGGTFASTTSEGSCAAITDACRKLSETLRPASEKVKDAKSAEEFWKGVIEQVYQPRMVGIAGSTVPLSAHGHFNGKETGGSSVAKRASIRSGQKTHLIGRDFPSKRLQNLVSQQVNIAPCPVYGANSVRCAIQSRR